MHLSGVILDLYDDPTAGVLRQKLAGRELPKELGDLELLDEAKLAELPDRLFALVATNGADVVRKYAMHDPAHTAVSVLYFMEQRELFPEHAQKIAAHNLVEGCGWYGLEVPEVLQKLALDPLGGMLGALDVKSRVEQSVEGRRATMDGFRRAQAGATADQQARDPGASQKTADLTGTEMMPMIGNVSTYPDPKNTTRPGASSSSQSKRAQWLHAGDLSSHHPVQKVAATKVAHYAMPSQSMYPIDSYANVKEAAAYFDEHMPAFHMQDRREFAFHLGARMSELGMKQTQSVLKYAGSDYGDFIDIELLARARDFEGLEHEHAYKVLLEKRASTPAHVMLEALHEIDVISGAATKYDATLGFRDPFAAVFGKTAEKDETVKTFGWNQGNDYVNDMMLTDLANRRYTALDKVFGMEMRKSFQKDPIGVFQSMPDPQKIVIARLASDEAMVG